MDSKERLSQQWFFRWRTTLAGRKEQRQNGQENQGKKDETCGDPTPETTSTSRG